MRILAVDPGPRSSGWAMIDEDRRPLAAGINGNERVREIIGGWRERIVIEMVASYGMAVGAEVFDTCVQIGRMIEVADGRATLVYRRDVKLHHCGSTTAKDTNVAQALVDRFAKGERNRGKGTKAEPGWFHGFAGDMWAAYALAVYAADVLPSGSSGE